MNKIDELQVFYFKCKVEKSHSSSKIFLYRNLLMVITVEVKW